MKSKTLMAFAIAITIPAAAALAQQKMDDMKSMPMENKAAAADKIIHKATATVKKVNAQNGVVTLAHGPVNSLNWPAMEMGFKVKDKALLKKLGEGKKVNVEFVQEGNDYVVTSVK